MNQKHIRVPQRILSWGEKMTVIRLAQTQRIRDDHTKRQNARRLKKQALSKPDNL